jgi:hypothetical protein
MIKKILDSSWLTKIIFLLVGVVGFLYGQAVFDRMDRMDRRSEARFERLETSIQRAIQGCATIDDICRVEDRLQGQINRLEDRVPFRLPDGG